MRCPAAGTGSAGMTAASASTDGRVLSASTAGGRSGEKAKGGVDGKRGFWKSRAVFGECMMLRGRLSRLEITG